METSLKTGFAQIFSCCPKNLSCPKFGGAAAPLAPPVRTPMCQVIQQGDFHARSEIRAAAFPPCQKGAIVTTAVTGMRAAKSNGFVYFAVADPGEGPRGVGQPPYF